MQSAQSPTMRPVDINMPWTAGLAHSAQGSGACAGPEPHRRSLLSTVSPVAPVTPSPSPPHIVRRGEPDTARSVPRLQPKRHCDAVQCIRPGMKAFMRMAEINFFTSPHARISHPGYGACVGGTVSIYGSRMAQVPSSGMRDCVSMAWT